MAGRDRWMQQDGAWEQLWCPVLPSFHSSLWESHSTFLPCDTLVLKRIMREGCPQRLVNSRWSLSVLSSLLGPSLVCLSWVSTMPPSFSALGLPTLPAQITLRVSVLPHSHTPLPHGWHSMFIWRQPLGANTAFGPQILNLCLGLSLPDLVPFILAVPLSPVHCSGSWLVGPVLPCTYVFWVLACGFWANQAPIHGLYISPVATIQSSSVTLCQLLHTVKISLGYARVSATPTL